MQFGTGFGTGIEWFNKIKNRQMYISGIIGYLMWPVMIWISYKLVRWALMRFEKIYAEQNR